jgi:hypothetical protein
VSRDSPYVSNPNALTPNALTEKSTYSLPRRLGAANFHTLLKTHPNAEIFFISLYEIDRRLRDLGAEPQDNHTTPPQTNRHSDGLHGIAKMNQQLSDLTNLSTNLSPNSSLNFRTNSTTARQAQAASLYLAGASLKDIAKALEDKQPIDPRTILLKHFHKFLPAFDVAAANTLPPHRKCDHSIKLKPGTTPPFRPLYNMSIEELQVLRKFLKENLDKGFIQTSTSPVAAPVLFAKKPGGGLRFYVDYRALNAITIKNRYPLPLLQETLSKLSKAKFYTKLDVIHAFNHIRIKEGHK